MKSTLSTLNGLFIHAVGILFAAKEMHRFFHVWVVSPFSVMLSCRRHLAANIYAVRSLIVQSVFTSVEQFPFQRRSLVILP